MVIVNLYDSLLCVFGRKARSLTYLLVSLGFLVNGAAQSLDETWTLTIAGQSVQANANGSFRIPNIAAPDLFGEGGLGTAPDFLSDDFLRLTGVSTQDGRTRYVFS